MHNASGQIHKRHSLRSLANPRLSIYSPASNLVSMGGDWLMTTPIFETVKATHDMYRATAKLEARAELAAELKRIPKPTKQVLDLIKKLEA